MRRRSSDNVNEWLPDEMPKSRDDDDDPDLNTIFKKNFSGFRRRRRRQHFHLFVV